MTKGSPLQPAPSKKLVQSFSLKLKVSRQQSEEVPLRVTEYDTVSSSKIELRETEEPTPGETVPKIHRFLGESSKQEESVERPAKGKQEESTERPLKSKGSRL